MNYLSICSGIESASVAFEPLGRSAVGFAEIDKGASRVLKHRWPHVRNYGDFTALNPSDLGPVGVMIGGTPCQSFSFAGKRQSLVDTRGNLTLAYAVLLHELARNNGTRWGVWENVPGVFSTDDNAFGCFLGILVGGDAPLHLPKGIERWPDEGMVEGPRARVAWRIFDAQYFGLAQRRRRVYVVIGLGKGTDPAAVLFERKGVRWHPPTRGETGKDVAGPLGGSAQSGGFRTTDLDNQGAFIVSGGPEQGSISGAVSSKWAKGTGGPAGDEAYNLVAFDTTQITHPENRNNPQPGDPCHPLAASGHPPAIAFDCKAGGDTSFSIGEIPGSLRGDGHGGGHAAIAFQDRFRGDDGRGYDRSPPMSVEQTGALETVKPWHVATQWAVRRLTPTECDRLQGFPDKHGDVPGSSDSSRYKQLGNSMPVPVIRWIGERIAEQEASWA